MCKYLGLVTKYLDINEHVLLKVTNELDFTLDILVLRGIF